MSSAGHKLILPGQNTLDTSPPIEGRRDAVAVDTPEIELLSVLTEGRPGERGVRASILGALFL